MGPIGRSELSVSSVEVHLLEGASSDKRFETRQDKSTITKNRWKAVKEMHLMPRKDLHLDLPLSKVLSENKIHSFNPRLRICRACKMARIFNKSSHKCKVLHKEALTCQTKNRKKENRVRGLASRTSKL